MSTMELYNKEARVWLKDTVKVWKAGKVTQSFNGNILEVEDEDGKKVRITVKDEANDLPPLRNPDILVGENDLSYLSYLHEAAVLHNLQVRFVVHHEIYTYCGIVLVAINPYQEMHMYNNDTIMAYRGKTIGDLDPHIYAVSEEAFTLMERDGGNQSVIISGESGAGKTVSAKYSMRYFATVGGTGVQETQVERRVVANSPIMEAMGNAKTTRNDNSSRFGKYIELGFSENFKIVGASMRTYLLEKSRVVFQAAEERNYHIFYQLCAARSQPELQGVYLKDCRDFIFTNQGNNPIIHNTDDVREFQKTHDSLLLLGFSRTDIKSLYKVVSALLYLGNVAILGRGARTGNGMSYVKEDDESLKVVAELLEVDEKLLRTWLCTRKIVTKDEICKTPMDTLEATNAKNALAKCIYSNLFDWIVRNINKALATDFTIKNYIGVLDIYGFESFEVNSFEQFCINYANEKLQQQFNMHVFKLDQEEYVREGIEWKMIDFYDNQPCIDLIESKLGILDLLDEECRMPKGTDKSWVNKLYDKCNEYEHFTKARLSQTAFLVTHFAEKVEYQSKGFLDKNRDTVLEEQITVLRTSRNNLVSSLFSMGTKTGSDVQVATTGKKANKKSVGSQFRDSLNLLMYNLNLTHPHYVRCIKPNDAKAAFTFDNKRAVQQLRACGVLETVRISAAGYPSRWSYHDFYHRYRVLSPSWDVEEGNHRTTCENILSRTISSTDKYQLGKNKLFFRAGQVAYLEKLRSDKLRACGTMIQKNVRMWIYKKKYSQIQRATFIMQRLVRSFLARRKVSTMRRQLAAVRIQAWVRGWIQLRRFNKLRQSVIEIQSLIRGRLARKEYTKLKLERAAVRIQARVRGYLARIQYCRDITNITVTQNAVRRFFAKKKLKTLKMEAKTVSRQIELNKGLENKIISLQQRLVEATEGIKAMKAHEEKVNDLTEELMMSKNTIEELKKVSAENENMERSIEDIKIELRMEKEANIQLMSEKLQLEEERVLIEEQHVRNIDIMKQEIEARLQEEKSTLTAEIEQERRVHQKLLMDFNSMKTEAENMREELHSFRENRKFKSEPGLLDVERSMYLQEIQELKTALTEERDRSAVVWDQLQAYGNNCTKNEECRVEEDEEPREKFIDGDHPIIPRMKSTGMFEYEKGEERKLLKVLITDLKPSVAAGFLPGLPAYVLFMLIRYLDHINDSNRIRDLIEGGISHIKKTVRKLGQTDIELKALWLSNTVKLLHCLKQYSGEPRFQLENTSKQKEQCLHNFDLSAYWKALSDIACWIYHGITEVIVEQLQPSMVIALLEHEGIKGLGGDKLRPQIQGRVGSKDTHPDPKVALDCLLIQLTSYHDIFQKQGVEKEIICQIFRQIFYFLCAGCLNNLLLRKDLCHWSRGMQIRYNVAQLEQWAQDQGLEDAGYRVSHTLSPIIQAAHLLQAKKLEENINEICSMCSNLRVSQIVKILNLYTPGDEFEDRVTPVFVRKIQESLEERAKVEDKDGISLLLDTKYIFYFRFHFKPSCIDFTELEAEDLYSILPNMLKKI